MTAVGVESQITEALLQRLGALTLSPALQVAYPNVPFPAAGATKPDTYLEANQLRADVQGIGISAWDEHAGIFQVDVVYKAQDGAIKPTQIADAVVAWFPRNLRLDINETPSIAAPIPDAPYSRTPVSIRYRVFVR
jgi:predicted secreted protein